MGKHSHSHVLAFIFIFFFSISVLNLHSQEILWEVALGGEHSEYLYDMQGTPDYGFILAGSSLSEYSGNKNEKGKGDLDYLLWKLDENGYTQWQKSFGGKGQDYLYSVGTTREGGYIIGGSTTTGKEGTKSSENYGSEDYWVLKLNAKAEMEWQQSYGGMGQDKLFSISQTGDGGYIIGGSSDSDLYLSTEDQSSIAKNENSRGNQDYWIIKTDALGEVEWQKTYGGAYYDLLRSIQPTLDGGYIVGGYSNSPLSGDKTEDNKGVGDYWILKLNTKGEIEWQQTLGGDKDDQLYDLITTSDQGYLLAGNSNSSRSKDKTTENTNGTDWWILKLNKEGSIDWQQSYDIAQSDILLSIAESKDKEGNTAYLLAGYAQGSAKNNEKGENDYIAIRIDEKGKELWRKPIGGKGVDQLHALAETRDGGYVLAGTSDSPKSKDKGIESKGQKDYYVVKLLDKDKEEQAERIAVEIYPNPTRRFATVQINENIDTESQALLSVIDMKGSLLQNHTFKTRSLTIDLKSYQPGVYLIKVQVNGKEQTFKVLKEGEL